MGQLHPRATTAALWDEMSRTFPSYPKGVTPVPEPMSGTAFFPGGLGLWLEDSESNTTEVMVVGQDFNTVAAYEKARQHGTEIGTSATCRNIRTIFPELGLHLPKCFFTNFYMGLRESGPETGLFPGARDSNFVQLSARFFHRQLEVIRPQLIVTLGTAPLKALGKHIFQIPIPKTLSACVDVYTGLPGPHGPVALVALTQPSLYFANVRRRRFRGLQGFDAEKAMVQSALVRG